MRRQPLASVCPSLLQRYTTRVEISGVMRYATPLLRQPSAELLKAPKEAVMANLRSTERRLAKDFRRAESYCSEMKKLQEAAMWQRYQPKKLSNPRSRGTSLTIW